jgi:VanZ family protein
VRKTSAWPLSLLYVVLIVYASLYPFDHWRDQGISPWAFLLAPWPKYWTGFDVLSNVLGYAPLGFLLALSALRMGLAGSVIVMTTLAAALLSLGMETLQSYLPARVPSWVDFVLNTSGAFAGAVIASALEHLGWIDRWSRFRARWFERDAYLALPLMAVWPVALLFPVSVPLGLGQVWDRLDNALYAAFEGTPFEEWIPLQDFELEPLLPGAQLLCVALGLLIPCLLGFTIIKQMGQRMVYGLWVCVMALGASALSAALTYGPLHAWNWLGQPEILGLSLGAALALIFALASRRVSATFLLLVLVIQQSLLNQAPESVYFSQTIQTWEQGQFIRFHGLVQWLGWLWPYAVLLFALKRLSLDTERANGAARP